MNYGSNVFFIKAICFIFGLGLIEGVFYQNPSHAQTPSVPTKMVFLKKDVVTLGVGQNFLKNWALSQYQKKGKNGEKHPVLLQKEFFFSDRILELAFDHTDFAYLSKNPKTEKTILGHWEKGPTPHWRYEDTLVQLDRVFHVNQKKHTLVIDISATFKKTTPKYAFLSLFAATSDQDPDQRERQVFFYSKKKVHHIYLKDDAKVQYDSNKPNWISASGRYFLFSIIPQKSAAQAVLLQPFGQKRARLSLVYPVSTPNWKTQVQVYFGPKDLNVLRNITPTLDVAVDFGWFTILAYPILRMMKWFYSFTHNYGLAIILLTLLIKLLMFPLTYKSVKSMQGMAKIQPHLKRIKEKYKDDKERLNKEMLTLMRSHGYNPLSGCLPILVQMPIFFALYRVLYSAVELYQAPFCLWITDLSYKDPYFVTPVLLTAVMYFQQKVTPATATDPMQKKMFQWMPVIFGVFMLTLPSGLTLYMLVNALFSIFQQLILNKKLGISHVQTSLAKSS